MSIVQERKLRRISYYLKFGAVILSASLGNGHCHRLMISGRNHGTDAVKTSR